MLMTLPWQVCDVWVWVQEALVQVQPRRPLWDGERCVRSRSVALSQQPLESWTSQTTDICRPKMAENATLSASCHTWRHADDLQETFMRWFAAPLSSNSTAPASPYPSRKLAFVSFVKFSMLWKFQNSGPINLSLVLFRNKDDGSSIKANKCRL